MLSFEFENIKAPNPHYGAFQQRGYEQLSSFSPEMTKEEQLEGHANPESGRHTLLPKIMAPHENS